MIDALKDDRKFEIILTVANGHNYFVPVEGTAKAMSRYQQVKDLLIHGHDRQTYWWEDSDSGLMVKVKDISSIQIIETF